MDFYRGDVAREIAADCERLGAPLTRDDLKKQDARWRDAYSVRLRDVTLYNAPPPSQGLAGLMIPGIVERLDAGRVDSAQHVHGSIEAARVALAVRDRECADFQWPTSDPERWLAADALEREAQGISMSRAGTPVHRAHIDEGVWMGAVDPSGLAVSCAQSLGLEWGSGCVLPNVGVLMSNAGRAFSLDEKSVHALHPARRPFQSLNAQLAAFADGAVAAYGASGGDGGPQITAQVFARVRAGTAPDAALAAPRFALAQGDEGARVMLEEDFETSIMRALGRAGHEVESAPPQADVFGRAGILHRARTGRIRGAHDPRGEGGAAGL
ncbi:MAG: gamma-glutamyltransferase family protein, partial [Beijerinckiaceae bacterium]|nr:gamma-glutamyltransferase family protein [Beijerinckiaceae bacterium]